MKKMTLIKVVLVFCFTAMCWTPMFSQEENIVFPRGDVSQDNVVNIEDVTVLINYLLTDEWPNSEPVTKTFTVNGVSFKMVAVEGGTFMMGATQEQSIYATDGEKPAHEVTLSSYCIGETEVTQALWVAVMGSNPSWFSPRKDYEENLQRPVECVSWNQCQEFITKLNQITGKNFRLPTEAEWEYAARGGMMTQGNMYAGSNNIDDVGWCWNNSCSLGVDHPDYGTHTVGSRAPNELGIYDMTGNVWEWVQDWYGNYSEEPQINPTGPASGTFRLSRGGSWDYFHYYCRVSTRFNDMANDYWNGLGLRLAL